MSQISIKLSRAVVALLTMLACVALVDAHPAIEDQLADLTARIAEQPTEAALYLRRGELHRIHREWKLAEGDYRHALKLDPQLIVAQQCIGKMMLESERPNEAIAPLEAFLARRPDDTKTLALLSRAYLTLGQNLKAAESYTRTLASVKEGVPSPEYYLERARALYAAGPNHLEAALAGLDDGLRVLNHPVTLQLKAIELELKHQRFDAALARLDDIASRSARQENWLIQRGQILEKAGRPEQAREAFQKTLDAIAGLPESRIRNRAVERLQEQAQAGIDRLDARRTAHDTNDEPAGR